MSDYELALCLTGRWEYDILIKSWSFQPMEYGQSLPPAKLVVMIEKSSLENI